MYAVGGVCHAEDRFGVGVKVGTLGLGGEFTGRLTNWLELRGTFNQYNLTKSLSQSEIDYDGDFHLGAYGVLADFHPLGNRFRLTAGILKNRTSGDLTTTPTQDITIGDNTYTSSQVGTLSGSLTFKSVVSYFGLGYGSAPKGPGRVGFVFDLGFMPQGEPQFVLEASGGGVSQADLDKEAQQVMDDTHKLKIWPVIGLGLSFRL
jgi:hypothetical protein